MPRKETQTIVRQEVLPPEPETTTELAVITQESASVILLDSQKFDEFYDKIKGETDAFKPDLTTEKGRKAIASEAFRVTKVKTTIDKAAKQLTEQWRTQTNTVNAARKTMVERLDALSDEVRAPLTAYEEAEKAKGERRTAVMASIVELRQIAWDDDSAAIDARAAELDKIAIIAEDWGGDIETIRNRIAEANQTLAAAAQKAREAEEAQAELTRLREAEDARQAEQAAKDASAAEVKAEQERKAKEELEAAAAIQRAKDEALALAAKEAEIEKAQVAAEHEAALKAERDKAAAIELDAQADRDRIAKEKADADAKVAAEVEAQRVRDEDRAHQSAVLKAAKEAIMEAAGIDEEAARKVVLAIRGGLVPNVTLKF